MMTSLDNLFIEQPSNGSLVSENSPLGHFIDNCIYVLPQGDTIDAEMVQKYINNVLQHTNEFINRYECEAFEDMPDLSNHPNLRDAIEKEKANLLLPINIPDTQNTIYLIVSSYHEDLFSNIRSMILYAESITSECLRGLLKQYAVEDSDSFCETIHEDSKNNYPYSGIVSNIRPGYDEFKNYKSQTLGSDLDKDITITKKMFLYEKIEFNIRKYKKTKDSQAEKALSFVIKELDTKTVLWLLSQLTQKQKERFVKKIDPYKNAKDSSLKIEIIKNGTVDDISGTDGVYRLCLNKDGRKFLVHFDRRESFIVYLIHLTDKYLNNSDDFINVYYKKEQFLKLFKINYDCNGTGSFAKLFKQTAYDNAFQPQLKNCYHDIRTQISNACEKLKENPLPYIIKGSYGHLAVLKSNIIIHEDILNIVKTE